MRRVSEERPWPTARVAARRGARLAFALGWLLGCAAPGFAQTPLGRDLLPPDRDRERIEPPEYERDGEDERIEVPATPSLPERAPGRFADEAAPWAEGFVARGFRIRGNSVFADAELEALLAPFLGREIRPESLPAITDRLTTHYVEAGYISSGAVVPDQVVAEGVLEIEIVEGGVARLEIESEGRLRRSFFEPRLRAGLSTPINLNDLETSLKLLQRDPRVERVDAVLMPARDRGESLLRLEVTEASPWTTDLRVANDLAPALGGRRGSASIGHRNVFGLGDSVFATVSGARGLFDLEMGYRVPVSPWLTELEIRGGFARGEVVEGVFADQNFRNELASYAVRLSQPVWRTLADEVRLSLELERRTSRLTFLDEDLPLALETAPGRDSRIRLLLLRLNADWLHRGLDQVFAARVRTTVGLDAWNATAPNDTPFGEPTLADAEFTAVWLQLQYARRVATWLGDGELVARGDLQWASGSLFSLESFSMGGASTVRGHHENAVVTDNGALASLELRLPFLPSGWRPHRLFVAPFLDLGFAWDDVDPNAKRFDQLYASLGLGLVYRYAERFALELYWGKPFFHDRSPAGDVLQNRGLHLEATLAVF